MRFLTFLGIFVAVAASVAQSANPERTTEILSPVYVIDKVYRSMEGPMSSDWAYIDRHNPRELVWITGFKTEMVMEDGVTPTLPEYMCHVNLDLDMNTHNQNFPGNRITDRRIMTLSQGQLDVKLPPGFGWPIMSDENMQLTTQVLNLNDGEMKANVRHKVTFTYIKDSELVEPIKPVMNTAVYGFVRMTPLEQDGKLDMGDGTKIDVCNTCLPGEEADNAKAGSQFHEDGFTYTGHWVVKPGRWVNETDVTRQFELPYDTPLHYAAIHVHPYCESVELYDKTAKRSVFKVKCDQVGGNRLGLSHVESFSSEEGVMLYKDHEYALIDVYDNPTQKNSDAMVAVIMFVEDKQFAKPDLNATAQALSTPVAPERAVNEATVSSADPVERIVLKTTAGELVVRLFTDIAPETAAQFQKLVSAGVYDGVPFVNVVPGFVVQAGAAAQRKTPMTGEQSALVRNLPLEASRVPHTRGTLSMARDPSNPDSNETSFCIMLSDAPQLDGLYTNFGRIEGCEEVLAKMQELQSKPGMKTVEQVIERAEVVSRPASAATTQPSGGM